MLVMLWGMLDEEQSCLVHHSALSKIFLKIEI